jgi:ABC-type branched-subunit amino acid transport system substrate-binding protein
VLAALGGGQRPARLGLGGRLGRALLDTASGKIKTLTTTAAPNTARQKQDVSGRRAENGRLTTRATGRQRKMTISLKKTTLALASTMTLAIGIASAHAEDGVIRIGVTLRMIVENGIKYGQMTKDELEGVNASGGINGHKVEVILLDDECKPDKGIANVNRFIHQSKVHLVMGSTCSSVSLPMVDITAKEEVPQIVPHSNNTNVTKKGSAWVFRTSVSERFYASVHAKYLSENVGK